MERSETFIKYEAIANHIKQLNEKYGLETTKIAKFIADLDKFQVVTPVIGKFSSGKSSLINALLGEKILGVAITPKTAVPTEICYGQTEKVILQLNDEGAKTISLEEFSKTELDADKVKNVQVFLNNEFLRKINTVKIVDMPGFDSGLELHQKAIDDYLPNAGAYIITFDARSAVVDRSMGNFIKELKVHNVPVFILITKSRAVTNENLLICKSNIQKGICELIGRENISIGCTETHAKSGNVDDFKEVLRKIEDRSQSLFELSSQKNISYFAGDLIVYLQSSIRKSELMPSELEGQLASVKKSMEVLSQVHSNSSNALQQQVADCASGIREELNAALTGNADYLVNGIVQNKDISDDINMICRESIINYVNNVVEPKLKSTIQKAANSLVVNIQFDVKQLDNLLNTKFYDDLGRILKDLSSGLCKFLTKELFGNEVAQGFAAGVTGLLSKGAMRSAGAIAAGGALGGIIGAAVTAVAAWLIEGGMNKLKEQEIRNKTEDVVYQQIIPDAVRIASVEFQKQINLVCDQLMSKMETEIREKLNAEQKSLNDLKEKYDIEQKDKLARIENMKNELTEIEALISFNN